MPLVSSFPKRSKTRIGGRVVVLGFAATLLFLSGCSTPQPKTTWWNPGTWFSGRAGDRVDDRKEDVRETQADLRLTNESLIRVAQEEAILTDIALEQAPDSPPVFLARNSTENTVDALDQVLGATDKSRILELEGLISDLLSDNEDLRQKAERVLTEKEGIISHKKEAHNRAQVALAEAEAKLAQSQSKLEGAFDRENALANKYRNVRFLFIGAIVILIIFGLVMVYLRFIGMGALGSIVTSIERFKGQPGTDDILTDISRSMNNRQKKFIRAQRARSIKKDTI